MVVENERAKYQGWFITALWEVQTKEWRSGRAVSMWQVKELGYHNVRHFRFLPWHGTKLCMMYWCSIPWESLFSHTHICCRVISHKTWATLQSSSRMTMTLARWTPLQWTHEFWQQASEKVQWAVLDYAKLDLSDFLAGSVCHRGYHCVHLLHFPGIHWDL